MTILKGFTQKISIHPKFQKESEFRFSSKSRIYFEKIKHRIVKYDHSSPFCISRMILKHLVRQKQLTKNRNFKITYEGHFKGIYTGFEIHSFWSENYFGKFLKILETCKQHSINEVWCILIN